MGIEEKFDSVLAEKYGHKKLAAAMTNPIRLQLDHYNLVRRLLIVDPLPPKTKVAKYDSFDGQVVIPKFVIESNIEVSRKNWIKIPKLVCKDIEKQEMGSLLSLLDAAVKESRQVVRDRFGKKKFYEALRSLEANDLKCEYILMNPKMCSRVCKLFRDVFDPQGQKDLIEIGIMGLMWGITVLVHKKVPANRIYFTAAPEFVGALPLYRDAEVVALQHSAAQHKEDILHIATKESVGMGIINVKGVSCFIVRK